VTISTSTQANIAVRYELGNRIVGAKLGVLRKTLDIDRRRTRIPAYPEHP
jgi:hypothetical protein